jgi:hypothetical protein
MREALLSKRLDRYERWAYLGIVVAGSAASIASSLVGHPITAVGSAVASLLAGGRSALVRRERRTRETSRSQPTNES